VRKFVSLPEAELPLKVPHIGWNTLQSYGHPLFQNLPDEHPFVYYVHSYAADIVPETIADTDYISPFSAALHKDNFYAVQFHPEKSSTVGATILQNFLAL
jgi:imidazole glycerol-phosphate synthase subunit HisH